ncbi:MAG TPA: FAD-dependent oxidoreductase [Bellilinea sp.]|jgi:2,4-dienoyl-CoA reductase-like NADH-dependent reductase (Old Yellow Enzyme family)/thioredoxin reductase|nr:FAD-dependent oxidoreductase [Bellilinea sp.]
MKPSKDPNKISRRLFLKETALTLAAGGALTACSPKIAPTEATDANTAGAETATVGGELIPQAYLNPQDYDYRQNTTDLKTLFSPLKIGPLTLNHRMVKSAAGSAAYLAGLTDELLQYYVQFAKGGIELIWVEMVSALEPPADGSETPAETIEFGKKLVAECGKYGAKLGYQHYGFSMKSSNDFTLEDIAAEQANWVKIAQFMQELGFVGIEINAAGFNLGEHFLSRFHNTRTDEYGIGSLENRARFVTECIEQIKAACGKDFVVQVLIDCIEENDNLTNNATLATLDNAVTAPHNKVTTIEEGIGFAKLFEAAGCDSMHLRLGPLDNHPCQFASDLYFLLNGIEGATGYGTQWDFSRHWQGQLVGNHSGAGMLIDIVGRYKEALTIPCGTVTYMDPAHAPDYFEKALADGKVDFYIMNRPLTVDNEYVHKLKEGRIDEIAPCTRCLHCHIGSNEMNRAMGYCRVNALTQRVMTENGPATYELEPATAAKKVMVIGGGPAGMEAARIAAARGHKVTLYEKSAALGGKLTFASMIKGPHENLDDLKAYLARQLEVNGVTVVLNKEVDAAFIESEKPEAVILAIGSLPGEVGVSGGSVPVIDFVNFTGDGTGENVIVFGSNAQAFDAALWLTVHKKKVTIVTPNPDEELDKQQSQHAHRFMTTSLYSLGVKVYPSSTIREIGDGKVTIASDGGWETIIAADSIINAADLLPNKSLLDGLSVKETYAIGDCDQPFNIALAIRAGNDIGRKI